MMCYNDKSDMYDFVDLKEAVQLLGSLFDVSENKQTNELIRSLKESFAVVGPREVECAYGGNGERRITPLQ